jgi:hypothetical protein
LAQIHYRWRNDSGSWAAGQDEKLEDLSKQTTIRIRFEVVNQGTTLAGTGATYQLQVAETATCGSGTYSAVPTGSTGHWKIADSANITDGQATTNLDPGLTDEGNTFVAGEEKDAGNTTGSITLDGDEFTEIEFAIQATANATTGGDYCFRLYNANGASTLDAYPAYAEVSIGSPSLAQIHYRWRNDDAGETGLYAGTGADGSAAISSYKNINTDVIGSNRSTYADGIATTVTTNPQGTTIGVASATGLAAGDEILLINMQGTSGASEYVGNYEFLRIDSVSGTSLYLTSSVQKSYGGANFASQKVVAQRVPQWTNVTISSGVSLTANAWNGTSGGIIVFRATGTVDVQSGATISASGLGYAGGAGGTTNGGTNGESYDGSVGSGGNDTSSGTDGGNPGTYGGGGSSNYNSTSPGGVRGGKRRR